MSVAAGTQEAPGANIRAKSGLNKSILDQGCLSSSSIRLQTDLEWWLADRRATTKHKSNVPNCRHVASENRKTQSEFRCIECGFEENADIVGGKHLKGGLSRLACLANETARRQQEPPKRFRCGRILAVYGGRSQRLKRVTRMEKSGGFIKLDPASTNHN